MKISEKTLNYLKNFASINPSILIKKGNILSTVSPQKNIMARAVVEEKFPVDFCIYELSRFLGTISLFDDPDFNFGETSVTIKSGNQSTKYGYADRECIQTPPSDEIVIDETDIEFFLDVENFTNIAKACSVLQLPEVAFVGDGQKISLQALDSSNQDADSHKVDVGVTSDVFKMIMKPENLKLMSRNYDIKISPKKVIEFSCAPDLKYWIATEASSTYVKGGKDG